jgi:hypothetical protein
MLKNWQDHCVSNPYRKTKYQELVDETISQYLVHLAIKWAYDINKHVPVYAIVLEPAHTKLVPFYQNLGFECLEKESWMFLKL